ncbi:MAG: M24 family metallopeptidase [Saprospiraceae bacterium]
MKYILTAVTCLLFIITVISQNSLLPQSLGEREQSIVIDEILEDRMDNLLPQLMNRTGIDMWIIISREYNEDPVMKTMLPSTWLSARRRTIMVFYHNGAELQKIAIARYSVGRLLKGEWNIDVYPDQWEALIELIKEKNPNKIGLNTSEFYGLADGLVHTEHEEFMKRLPKKYLSRIVSAEDLSIAWLETRSKRELQIYPMICRMAHVILRETLSEEVIHPGITTTDDVVWALRQRVADLGLKTWFHPSVSVQRSDMKNNEFLRSFSKRPKKDIIQFGDMVHVDFGITYLRLNTDQQQMFYVLRPGENDVPHGLKKAFANGNKLQDILISNFEKGRSGNEILKRSLATAKKEGLNASIYTHPIGFHGHAAGPTIGMWDKQKGVKGTGDYPLFGNTTYSIELFAATEVPEWDGKIVRIMLEEDGVFNGESFYFLDGRQKEIMTIPGKHKIVKH